MRLDKVIILCFGPDWPVSVLAGILRLSVFDMVFCSTPIIIVIVPPVLVAAFKYRAVQDPLNKDRWMALAQVMTLATAALMLLGSLLAGYFVQHIANDEKIREDLIEKTSMSDEDRLLDAQVAELAKYDALWKVAYRRKVIWQRNPIWLRVFLFCGSILMTCSLYVVLLPEDTRYLIGLGSILGRGPPFVELEVTDKLSEMPGGLWGLVRPPGRIGGALLVLSGICLVVDLVWLTLMAKQVKMSQVDCAPREASSESEVNTPPVVVRLPTRTQ